MDEGPEPKRNFKPVEKVDNSVDQFWNTHQAEYEARGKPSADHVDRVHKHNMAYPKLRDELDKRGSATMVSVLNSKRSSRVQPSGTNCKAVRIKQLTNTPKKVLKQNQKKNTNKTTKGRNIKTIKKNRVKTQKSRFKPLRSRQRVPITLTTRGCQCLYVSVMDKKINTQFGAVSNLERSNCDRTMADVELFQKRLQSQVCINKTKSQCPSNSKEKTVSIASTGYPDTSIPSLSSYNSYVSMDHEPMVSD